MITGKIKFAAAEKSLFFPTLKDRIDQYFAQGRKSRYANKEMIIKTIVLLSGYIIPYIILLAFAPPLAVSLVLWLIMGASISGIGMSVMHDANHGAFSKSATINKWLGRTIYLAGAGVVNWKLQHNVLHHTYTNVADLDEDIKDRGVVKLSPHDKAGPMHRLQWIYAFLFYGIVTLYWVLLKDFIQYYHFIKAGINRQSQAENQRMLAGLIILKTAYLGIFFAIPVLVFKIAFWQILIGFLLMHFTAGLILTVIFQLAHSVEGTQYPLPDDHGVIHKDWATHQLETTVNFSADNKWLSWYIGGLNYQIEHHLFPKICHVHYPELAPIVKQTATEFGLTYLENKTFSTALKAHIRSLKRFGAPNLEESIV
ncbi:acyl-CoA desaturase [Dyadobacter sp. CY261]|uniref:fatty acid desaturase family protein n=1 Tax=Dyadobacter sp. CY261 TaxID=2907203 RepID=UPI001F1E4077|nr:acyl-CoA desaturase [Dyadobacter sp. CY261]MCF0071097.1 acyl-CoA desaturase [Dyadobacter sp. CY261]